MPIFGIGLVIIFLLITITLFLLTVCTTITIFILCINYYKKHRDSNENKRIIISRILLSISIIIGITWFLFIINIIGFATGIYVVKERNIQFTTTNEINNVSDKINIEQSFYNATKRKFRFLTIHEEHYPSGYHIKFDNISEEVIKIKINSIVLIVNEERRDITEDSYPYTWDYCNIKINYISKPDIIERSDYDYNTTQRLRKDKEIIVDKNKHESFLITCAIKFDYNSVDYIDFVHNIELELESGEIINIEETTRFVKMKQ